jgi:DNA-binding response OmpR family regulator
VLIMDAACRHRPRVLVADDDVEMRRLVAESLRRDDYEVTEESDGGRLLVRVASVYSADRTIDRFDLIVSDIRMPVCSGLEILKGLREAHWKTPVILMTAFGDEETKEYAERLGALLIDKPFKMDVLRLVVRGLLHLDSEKDEPASGRRDEKETGEGS